MYGNNNYGGYMPYNSQYSGYNGNQGIYTTQQPFMPQTPNYAPQPAPQQMTTNKVYVTGVEDAKSRQLPPNSDYIFLDNDKPLLYRKTVDATGKMEIKAFKISEYTETEAAPPPAPASPVDLSNFVSRQDFEEVQNEVTHLKKTIEKLTAKTKKEVVENG